jgi:hypothetical protein
MGSPPPPRTCFQMLPSPEVLGLNAQHSSRPSGSVAWACSFEPVPSGQGLLAPLLPAIDGLPVAPPPAGRHPAVHPGGRNGRAVPFRHLSLPPVALAVLAPEATRSLTRRPALAIYRSRPRRHSARLTPAHDCGCPSTPGLRPGCLAPACTRLGPGTNSDPRRPTTAAVLRLRASGLADPNLRRPKAAAVFSDSGPPARLTQTHAGPRLRLFLLLRASGPADPDSRRPTNAAVL